MPGAPTDDAAVVYPSRRALAADNREKILAAARRAFLEPSSEVSMAQIARAAGVGMATLYRNFPGRPELVEALYVEEVDRLCAAANESSLAPLDALTEWLHRLFDFLPGKRVILAELFEHTARADEVATDARQRALDAGRPLIRAAQDTGAIRSDLTIEQIFDLTVAVAKIDRDPAYLQPIFSVMLDGLRSRADVG